MIHDAIVVGAGPAGCVCAIILARAGARVLLIDRAAFPRDKLCGDTINPGALALLRRLKLPVADRGLPIEGMVVSGVRGVRVVARYPPGVQGRAIVRRHLDFALLLEAEKAGAAVEERVLVQHPVVDDSPTRQDSRAFVRGLVVRGQRGHVSQVRSRLVIAADGRQSRIARHLSLATCPASPRRWAVGAYFEDVSGLTRLGEMHVRPRHYIGVAPLPGGIANACVVCGDRGKLRDPAGLLAEALNGDPDLQDRFAGARMIDRPITLGPLAVDCPVPGVPGLLLAGDAAGFIDPMTGDGLRFAIRGAELAAAEALRALETGAWDGADRLEAARRREFRKKCRFNRALRRVTASAGAVHAASYAARFSSWPVSRLIGYAGDVSAA